MIPFALSTVVWVVARTTLVLLLALGATTLLRRASAATRHLVWTVALAGVLVLPFLDRVVPQWRVVPVPAELAPVAAHTAAPVAEPVVAGEPAHFVAPASAAPASEPRTDWMMWIVGVWAAGGVLLLARLVAGVLRIWWVERRSAELADERWISLTDGLARRLRLGRMVTLLRGENASVPMTWGIVRPVVLLPAEADGWTEERRTVVLAHELAHIRRWDALTQWIAHLAVAVHWYNPLVWAAARRLRQEREQACDDAVLALGARPAVYADHLLDIVRSLGTASGPAAALAMARRSQFEGRLLAILDVAVPRTGVGKAVWLATMLGGTALILPLAALSPAERAAGVPSISVFMGGEPGAHPYVVIGDPALPPEAAPEFPEPPEDPAHAALESLREVPASLMAMVTADSLMAALRQQSGHDLYDEIIRMAHEIASSSDRRLVLTELLEHPDLTRAQVTAILDATHTMDSDTERRLVLLAAAHHRALGGDIPDAMIEALRLLTSSTEQRLVITGMLEEGHPSTRALASLIRAVEVIASDTEKRLVLTSAASNHKLEGAARAAYVAAVDGISSDLERRLALSALLGGGSTPAPPTPAAPPAPASYTARRLSVSYDGRGQRTLNTTIELNGEHDGAPSFRLSIRARNVRLAQGGVAVSEILPGGALEIDHTILPGSPDADALRPRGSRATVTRTLRMTRGRDGAIVRSYRVNGVERAWEAESRAWLADMLRRSR